MLAWKEVCHEILYLFFHDLNPKNIYPYGRKSTLMEGKVPLWKGKYSYDDREIPLWEGKYPYGRESTLMMEGKVPPSRQ